MFYAFDYTNYFCIKFGCKISAIIVIPREKIRYILIGNSRALMSSIAWIHNTAIMFYIYNLCMNLNQNSVECHFDYPQSF